MNFDPCFNILYGYYREKMGQTTVLLRSLSPGKPNRLNVACPRFSYIIRPGRPSRDDIENPIWRAQQSLQLSNTNSEELLEAVGEL